MFHHWLPPYPTPTNAPLIAAKWKPNQFFAATFFFAKIEILRRFVANSAAILALWFLLPLATPYHNY